MCSEKARRQRKSMAWYVAWRIWHPEAAEMISAKSGFNSEIYQNGAKYGVMAANGEAWHRKLWYRYNMHQRQ
jgi:hypothetical protein